MGRRDKVSITKTDAKTWRVRVEIGRNADGKRVRKTGTFSTKREATDAETLWKEQARTNVIVRDKIILADLISEWYLPEAEKRVRYTTLRRYNIDINRRILPSLGNRNIDTIGHGEIQHMLDNCKTYKTAKTTRDTLRQILNFAKLKGFLSANPAEGSFAYPPEKIREFSTEGWITTFAAQDAFINQVDNRLFRTMCVVGLGFGLRMDEIFGLNWSDIDFNKSLIHIRQAYIKAPQGWKLDTPKTKKSVRAIPMRQFIYDELQELRKASPSVDDSVCCNEEGFRANPSKTSVRWRKYVKRKGIQALYIGNMRHSFATACLNAGVDVTKVSKLLGHTNIQTTVNHYLRFKAEDLVDEFKNL